VWSLIQDYTLLNDYPSSDRPAAAEGLAGIIRLIRRVCLFREQGEAASAARLQNGELASAVAEYRLWHGPEKLTEEAVCALFVNETDHVREAMVMAELMAPQLARLLSPSSPPQAPVFPPVLTGRAAVQPLADGPPAITDLLDAMLAAERPGRRSPSANQRES
jgi:hypothetical protein